MKCLKCDSSYNYSSIHELTKHLKFIHNVQNGDKINCVAEGCGQYFSRLYNFIRHYERFHDVNTVAIYKFTPPDNNVEIHEEIENSPIENSKNFVDFSNNINVNDLAFDFCSEIMTKNNATYTSTLNFVELTSNLLRNTTNFLELSLQSSGIKISPVKNDFEKVKNLLTPYNSVYKFKQQFEK